jgi:hypothetical protein
MSDLLSSRGMLRYIRKEPVNLSDTRQAAHGTWTRLRGLNAAQLRQFQRAPELFFD